MSFELATKFVASMPSDGSASNETKLKFYAFFKQANVGKCSEKGGSQPWSIQLEARAKWDAWNSLGNMSSEDAKTEYVKLLDQSHPGWKEKI